MMPTGPKLFAAILMACLAFVVSQMIKPLFPQGTDLGWFSQVNAGIGLVIGWMFLGVRCGTGYANATAMGLTAVAGLVFWGLLAHSVYVMVVRSMRMMYDGPMEAVLGVFELMLEHAHLMAVPSVIGTLVAGGLILGALVEWSSRRWA